MRRSTVLLLISLLATTAFVVAAGSGAISSFSADRQANMGIVNDAAGFVGLSSTSDWAFEDEETGKLYLDFTGTNPNADGLGFNPDAVTLIDNVFAVTNQSTNTVFVWFESPDWSDAERKMVEWKVDGTNSSPGADMIGGTYDGTPNNNNKLLDYTPWHFVNGQDGEAAYVELDPGESFAVKLEVAYGEENTDLSHTIRVKADTEAPQRP